jgi:DNA-directed RNA polymerase specialized sigma24 family protein
LRDNPPPAPDGGQAQAAGRADVATQVFTDHRELLFAIVYDLLGSVADTEDVLQETWLAWAGRAQDPGAAPIANPRGYLVRVAVNQALARQAAIRRRRETYVGPWLPEPLLTGADAADPAVRAETVSVALLVVLGRDRVARFMTGVASRGLPSQPSADLAFRYLLVNGDPAVLLFEGGAPFAVIVLDLTRTGDQVQTVYAIGNPDKLSNLRRSLQQTQEPD